MQSFDGGASRNNRKIHCPQETSKELQHLIAFFDDQNRFLGTNSPSRSFILSLSQLLFLHDFPRCRRTFQLRLKYGSSHFVFPEFPEQSLDFISCAEALIG